MYFKKTKIEEDNIKEECFEGGNQRSWAPGHPSYGVEMVESTALAGTTRSLINNMVIGVSEGFQKTLLLVGVGYRAKASGKKLELTLRLSSISQSLTTTLRGYRKLGLVPTP